MRFVVRSTVGGVVEKAVEKALGGFRATLRRSWTLPQGEPPATAKSERDSSRNGYGLPGQHRARLIYHVIDWEPSDAPGTPLRDAPTGTPGTAWDAAHALLQQLAGLEMAPAGGDPNLLVEPDLLQGMPTTSGPPDEPSKDWPFPPQFAWHLGPTYTQLTQAQAQVPSSDRVILTILDTGIWPAHMTTPSSARLWLQHARNLVDGGNDVTDPMTGGALNNPGHGAMTLALLASGRINVTYPNYGWTFAGDFGASPRHPVIPHRIGNSVVHFYSSAMAEGISEVAHFAASHPDKDLVCSISMGGLPLQIWADAVNAAYDAGVTVVAAAGNNWGGLPTPYVVYPSRFNRVLTAVGATSKKEPYLHSQPNVMQGCIGPPSVMRKAVAAYTPQIPRAVAGTTNDFGLDGAGTSCATPQVAGAAALWLEYRVSSTPAGWRRVEAVRHALFQSADKSHSQFAYAFGQGLLRANDALAIDAATGSTKQPLDRVSFPFLRMLLGWDEPDTPAEQMIETEAAQLALGSPVLGPYLGSQLEATQALSTLDRVARIRLVNTLANDVRTSATLRGFLKARMPR